MMSRIVIVLTVSEKAQIAAMAGDVPLSKWCRKRLLGINGVEQRRVVMTPSQNLLPLKLRLPEPVVPVIPAVAATAVAMVSDPVVLDEESMADRLHDEADPSDVDYEASKDA